MANKTAPAPAPAAPKLTPCECRFWEVGPELDPEDDTTPIYTTECPGTNTARVFAPGHDAKLKSLLIRAGVAGWEARRRDGTLHTTTPEAAGNRFGFGHMVRDGIERKLKQAEAEQTRKAMRAAEREGAKSKPTAKPEAKAETKPADPPKMPRDIPVEVRKDDQPQTEEGTAKLDTRAARTNSAADALDKLPDGDRVIIRLGRFTYDAVIDAQGTAQYVNAKGALMDAAKGVYKLPR